MKNPVMVFCDIDGSILLQKDEYLSDMLSRDAEALPGVIDKFNEWSKAGHLLILTTARPESTRDRTEEQLKSVGLFYHYLVMDCYNSPRYLINDVNPSRPDEMRAIAINLDRNKGMEDLDLEMAAEAQIQCKEIYNNMLNKYKSGGE